MNPDIDISHKPAAYVAIGDVHGCSLHLDTLLDALLPRLDPDWQLVFIGDYCDRGPDTRGTIDRLTRLADESPTRYPVVFLRGNHDQLMMEAMGIVDTLSHDRTRNDSLQTWLINGARQTLSSYGITHADQLTPEALPFEHVRFLRDTHLFHGSDDFFFVHAGLLPTLSIAENLMHPEQALTFLWTREHLPPLDAPKWDRYVVCGHTVIGLHFAPPSPLFTPQCAFVDSGAFVPFYSAARFGRPVGDEEREELEERGVGVLTAALFSPDWILRPGFSHVGEPPVLQASAERITRDTGWPPDSKGPGSSIPATANDVSDDVLDAEAGA